MNGGVFTRKVYVRYLGEIERADMLFWVFEDSSKEVRRAVVDVMAKNKEYEEKVIACLQAKKLAVRETAVDVLASWGAENYRDVLLKVLETEKSKKLVEKIQTLLAVSVAVDGDKPVSVSAIVADIHKGGRSRQLSWLYDNANFTEVHFTNGTVADEKYVQAVMLCYVGMSPFGVNENAKILAKSVVTSSLMKAAIYGHDANWGRILCALGYSGVTFDPEKVDLYFRSSKGVLQIIEDGIALDYSEEEATRILKSDYVTAVCDMKMGDAEATAWGCDLTYDYVKINADYRS
jgi:hypothetical protein